MLAVCYSSSSASDPVFGTTGNVTTGGYTWGMSDWLPNQTGLVINGVYFRYTTIKDPAADLLVTIRNKDNEAVGYIYSRTHDWSGVPGNTIVGYDPLPGILGTRFGMGEIVTEGEGEVVDPTVRYNYKYDTCAEPINDPTCPGFEDALYKYLLDNGLLNQGLDINDPYYDQWVQSQLNREVDVAELDEEETIQEETIDEENSDLERRLDASTSLAEVAGGNQNAVMAQLATVPQFDAYYTVTIDGGAYPETITLQDSNLPDNRRALSNLANDATHRSMVRSQYENN